jgi:hypothetical protein
MIELLIQNGSTVYEPVVEGSIKWETDRKGQPGKLTFSVVPDGIINFQEGNSVSFKVDDLKVFYGFVFKKERDKNGIIKVTAYDQLRYLKNKDTYVYSNKTAGELIQMIAADFNLRIGTLEDTGFKIASRVEDNKSLMEMIQNALDLTLQGKNNLYVLFDDFGSITLKNVESMKLNLLIDDEAAENFKYQSSIDGETYNKIKLSYENEEAGKREIYIAQDSASMNNWGVLQYFESINEEVNGKAKADALLKLYNKKKRSLKINNAFGDPRVRAGSSIPISLNLGDVVAKNYMVVEKATHTFSKDNHVMNLTLKGGVINA